MIKKKMTRSSYVKKLDSIFSRYIRLSSAVDGICQCITCGKTMPWKAIQNGHFVSRRVYRYRRDIDNCYPQCAGCNIFLSGNYQVYTLKMIDLLGRDRVEEMMNNKKPFKISTPDIIDDIEYYTEKVDDMLDTLKNTDLH